MKILFHICCAPCFIAIYKNLKDKHDINGLWFNPNIHPYLEYQKRKDTLKEYMAEENIFLIEKDFYNVSSFLQKIVYREENRCEICYYNRLQTLAIIAKNGNYDSFSTTLLYSKFQNHACIKEIGENLAKKYSINFYYEDFRELWQEGIKLSKEKGMYRQNYCGCIYSEQDRFLPKKRNK